jgi:putative transposase
MHAQTLWQCDFFSRRVISRFRLPQVFAMVFLNVATRRVWVSPATRNPTEVWVEEQARAFIEYARIEKLGVDLVTRDNDQVYKKGFDRVMKDADVKSVRLAIRAPNTNAFVERFIQTLQVECLDHFLVFGEKHLDYLVREYVEHYHTERPHQGLGNRPVSGPPPDVGEGEIVVRTRLGGLLKHYQHAA